MWAIGLIDVQNDFMNADGALYVPGAEAIKPLLYKIVRLAWVYELPLFYTQDEHDGTEPEMKANGGPFPLHCMKGTEGQKNILEAPLEDALNRTEVFTKRCYNVFDETYGNPKIKKWLKDENITKVYLSGVATEYCVKACALGLAKLGITTHIIWDAVKGIDEKAVCASMEDFKEAGVNLISYNRFLNLL
jgi:nicotinamidase/pyrazinamidase